MLTDDWVAFEVLGGLQMESILRERIGDVRLLRRGWPQPAFAALDHRSCGVRRGVHDGHVRLAGVPAELGLPITWLGFTYPAFWSADGLSHEPYG